MPDGGSGGTIDLPGRNLLAARVTQNIFAQSKVGLIFTNGSQTGERNSLAGMDFNYSSSKFLGDKNIMLAAWGVYNWNETRGRAATTASASGPTIRTTSGTSRRPTPITARPSIPAWAT